MTDDAVYRAVFLRMHPTGKVNLSLSEASQGEEETLAGIVGEELGIPPEDVKVVHEDTNRFGEGNSFSTRPSDAVGENVAITSRKLRDKAQIVAGSMLDAPPESLRFEGGHWATEGGATGVRIQEVSLHTFGAHELPEGIEGSLDAQTVYKLEPVQASG